MEGYGQQYVPILFNALVLTSFLGAPGFNILKDWYKSVYTDKDTDERTVQLEVWKSRRFEKKASRPRKGVDGKGVNGQLFDFVSQ